MDLSHDSEESSRRTIENLDGKLLGSWTVCVGPYLYPEELKKQRDLQMKQGLVIHVSDFNAWATDKDEPWDTFSDCGTITTSHRKRTLEEYKKVLEEKRKSFPALKSEERKVELDKDFESMQLLSNKKNEEFFVKLGSNKDKRKEAGKEVNAKKVLNLNEFLKPAEGERYNGPGRGRGHGPGRGRGPGPRGGHGGIMGYYGPEIEDQQQFPTLGSK